MSGRRIAGLQTPAKIQTDHFEVVDPRPLTPEQALDLLYLAWTLDRWHRVLDACNGDREHALRVWNVIGRAEAAA